MPRKPQRLIRPPAAARLSSFFRPRWLVVHAVLLGGAIGMVFLGRWQLHVSEGNDYDLQNVSYVVQWWAFSAYAVFFWTKLVRDARRPPDAPPSTGGEIVRHGGRPGTVALTGPANLVQTSGPGNVPVVYRGYVLPDSSTAPHRSYGDSHHDAYNDYLWQLSMADGGGAVVPTGYLPPAPSDPGIERPVQVVPEIEDSSAGTSDTAPGHPQGNGPDHPL